MSLFGNILAKLGFGADKAAAPAQMVAASATDSPADAASAALAAAAPVPTMTEVDVMAKLDGLAALNPEKLNWKVSIVDLMKLLGLDSSLAQRKELATELSCPADKMADSADEYVAAQDRAAKAGRKRRQRAKALLG